MARAATFSEPGLLIDPEGEGVYLHEGTLPSVLTLAAQILYGTRAEWRSVESQIVYMRPGDDDHWRPVSIGRWPRGWRLNLPRRWRPVTYVYCTPAKEHAATDGQPFTSQAEAVAEATPKGSSGGPAETAAETE